MKKTTRLISVLLAAILLFTSCAAQDTGTTAAASDAETAAAGQSTDAGTSPAETAAAETSPAETAAAGTSAPAGQTTDAQTSEPASQGALAEAQPAPADAFLPFAFDDVAELPDLADHGSEADAAEADRIDRAMRAYTAPDDCPLVNEAPLFWYYSKLDRELQKIYDALLMAAEDPSGENFVSCFTDVFPGGRDFINSVNIAFYSMLYDHPELFWLYQSQSVRWKYCTAKTGGYAVYFYVDEYPTFREDVTAFNDAVEAFLAEIDTKGSQKLIAKRVHNRLIRLVDYDYDLAERNTRDDLGHTAYGALVANSAGQANHAVCDGYSLAYNYLLQQLGIPAVLMIGWAGDDETDTGCHAWSVIRCGKTWYEVDTTWDDFGNIILRMTQENNRWLDYWKEIYSDREVRDMREHYLFALSTNDIRSYRAPKDGSTYLTKDKKWIFTVLSDSVHIRDSELHSGTTRSAIIALAPTAK